MVTAWDIARIPGGPSWEESACQGACSALLCIPHVTLAGHLAFLVFNFPICKLRELWFWCLLFLMFSVLLLYLWYAFKASFLLSLNSLFSQVLKTISKVNQSWREKGIFFCLSVF